MTLSFACISHVPACLIDRCRLEFAQAIAHAQAHAHANVHAHADADADAYDRRSSKGRARGFPSAYNRNDDQGD